MNRSGLGIGSASVTLIFAVLCLTILALISHVSADNDKALSDAEAKMVIGYYNADVLAERVVAELNALTSENHATVSGFPTDSQAGKHADASSDSSEDALADSQAGEHADVSSGASVDAAEITILPGTVLGVEIASGWDNDLEAPTAEFSCVITDVKELYVKIALRDDSYEVLSWKMRDSMEWELDDWAPVFIFD
ncbi:MAG: hypothetical protein FWH55_02985 [Oscillospiraceae bacterium]|nr:hypothetical protein [Oscillospiraceae bacterium]